MAQRVLPLPRQQSFCPPTVPNPFVHPGRLSARDKLRVRLAGRAGKGAGARPARRAGAGAGAARCRDAHGCGGEARRQSGGGGCQPQRTLAVLYRAAPGAASRRLV